MEDILNYLFLPCTLGVTIVLEISSGARFPPFTVTPGLGLRLFVSSKCCAPAKDGKETPKEEAPKEDAPKEAFSRAGLLDLHSWAGFRF